ncbi:MAG: trehalose-phosphatase [Gammaproteobacteria bacterium]|nr:trehalose-phosphatase [Gammaproteobacteria bacterium]MDH3507815.1 trehalose-phosphatase [Gammaproteobacteria bacterium]
MTEQELDPAWPEHAALFLDLDGTLLEFAETPDGVEITERFKALLRRLDRVEHGAVAFVSGRTIARLDELLAPHRFALAGVHGSERRRSTGRVAPAPIDSAALDPVRERLRRFATDYEGVLIEDKGISLALHYRQQPGLAAVVEQLGTNLAAELPSGWEMLEGNHVLEIKPAGIDKGAAIRQFMSEAPFAGRTPVFIGDDVTDEAGFRAVNELGGVSVKVNSGSTDARWHLPDVDAVLGWLEANVPQ